MSHNCFVPGCPTGSGGTKAQNRKKGLKNPSLFRPPRDMIKKWENAIKRGDKKLEPTNVVCEIHFLESEIERFYVTQLPDGSVFSLKRGIPKLKDGAVPSVFPGYRLLMEQSLPSLKKKELGKQETITQSDLNQQQHEIENLQSIPSTHDSEMISTSSRLTTRFKLEDLDSIEMPSEYWFACLVAGNMEFTSWKEDLSLILKRVVIDPSLNITVFFCESSVNIDGIRSVGDISSISKVLAQIHDLNVCLDALGEERSIQCTGYITKDNRKGPQKKRCLFCKKSRDSLCGQKRKEEIHIQKQKKIEDMALITSVKVEDEYISDYVKEEKIDIHEDHWWKNVDSSGIEGVSHTQDEELLLQNEGTWDIPVIKEEKEPMEEKHTDVKPEFFPENIPGIGTGKDQFCDFATSNKFSIKSHIKDVHTNVREHICHLCNFAAAKKADLRIHINRVHLNLKEFKCHLCDYKTKQKKYLQLHIDRVHSKLEKPPPIQLIKTKKKMKERIESRSCHLCEYTASRKYYLKFHLDTVHLNLKEHQCPSCDFATSNKYSLNRHIKSFHTSLRDYKCVFCDLVTTKEIYLKSHINRMHSKSTDHKCYFCSHTTNDVSSLKLHIDEVHLNLNQHK